MWIKKLYATFGKLENKTLDLSPGLNIISGGNEAGKSTWSAFIRAMFFGISTKEKAKAGFIPDKEKYLPWSGAPMYGKMELCRGEEEIIVERTPSRTGAVFSKEEAKTSSGERAPTGEALLGVARGVYERSAFIAQARLSIDGDKDTEKRILSLASSGDETISASEVISRLEKKRREIRAARGVGGALSEIETELACLSSALDAATGAESEKAELEESLDATDKLHKSYLRSLAIAEAEESKKRRGYATEANRLYEEKASFAKKAEGLPTRELYDSFLTKKAEWQTLVLRAERESSALKEALGQKAQTEREIASVSAFSGMNEELAEKKAHADIERAEANASSFSLSSCLLLLLGLSFAVAGVFVTPLLFAAAGISLSAFVVLFFLAEKRKKATVSDLILKYGKADRRAIEDTLSRYCALLHELHDSLAEIEKKKTSAINAKASADIRARDLEEILAPLGFCLDTAEQAQEKLKRDMLSREEAIADLKSAQIRLEAIANTAEDSFLEIEYTENEIPSETKEELSQKASELELRKKNLELSLAALRERISGFDKSEAVAAVSSLSEKAKLLSARYDALSLAISTLDEADRELKSRFSPEVERRASEIFEKLTGGSFKVVRILDNDFDMNVSSNAASSPRDKLFLSQGTLDELYLALRLALCDTILPQEEMPPMVLDDVLTNFDDERAFRTLSYLKELAKTRQILLFTCHSREAAFFKDDREVNKIAI